MSIAGVGAYTVGATILCALTTTASNVHAMMGMVNEALWTEPNGPTVGCIHETAHPRAGDDPRCPEGMSLWKETWRPHRAGRAAPLQRKGIDDNSSRGTSRPARSRGRSAGHYQMDEARQQQVDLFAESTGDHQWIHTDPQRAARGPFKGTVAHSFLTLSLTPMCTSEVLQIRELTMAFTYGLGKVNFCAAVPVGSLVPATVSVIGARQKTSGVESVFGRDRPACTAEVSVLYPGPRCRSPRNRIRHDRFMRAS